MCGPRLYLFGLSKGNIGDGTHGEEPLGAQKEHFACKTSCLSQNIWQDSVLTLVF